MGRHSVDKVRQLCSAVVLDALRREGFARLTLDFDGSVTSTRGHAEGHRGRLQHAEEGGAQLLQPVLWRRPGSFSMSFIVPATSMTATAPMIS